jgi:hypothetical protein
LEKKFNLSPFVLKCTKTYFSAVGLELSKNCFKKCSVKKYNILFSFPRP